MTSEARQQTSGLACTMASSPWLLVVFCAFADALALPLSSACTGANAANTDACKAPIAAAMAVADTINAERAETLLVAHRGVAAGAHRVRVGAVRLAAELELHTRHLCFTP